MPKIVSAPKAEEEKHPIITDCPHCRYTISYTEDEVERVSNNAMGVYCPQCGGDIEVKHIKPFTFPNTFYYFSANNNAVRMSDENIQRFIDNVKQSLETECNIGDHVLEGSGDVMVFGVKNENEDTIYVARDYWEDSVYR